MDYTKQDRRIESLKPIMQEATRLLISEAKRFGIDVFITETLRTKDRQMYLYCQGRSVQQCINGGVPTQFAKKHARSGNQVTWTLNSNHVGGLAVDFACSPPQNLYDEKVLEKLGKLAISLGMNWGGSFGDSPHFEITESWKNPMKNNVPQWQIDSQKYCIDKMKLDDKYWTEDKLGQQITRGEMFGLIKKVIGMSGGK